MTPDYHLAQINIARMRAPLDDPLMQGFVAGLEPVNALADDAPGFVWRLQTDAGDATSLQVFDDAMLIVNMSVWESIGALKTYVYESQHVAFVKQRKAWFERFNGVYYALWWVPAGHVPTVEEAKGRLEHLKKHGESAHAFKFTKVFPAPGTLAEPVVRTAAEVYGGSACDEENRSSTSRDFTVIR